MRSQGFRIAIVNPLTLIGQEIQSILNERGIPYARMELIDSVGEAAGALTEINEEATFVSEASQQAFVGLDLVFFCGPRSANEKWMERAGEEGFLAIDASTDLEGNGAPVVAGINEELLEESQPATSAHPLATALVLLLRQLTSETPLRLCAASIIQPASDSGKAGVDELYQQTIGALNMQSMPKNVFDRQLAFNMYPAANAEATERLITQQVEQVLARPLPLTVNVTQGTTFHGHSLALFVQYESAVSEDRVRELLARGASIEVAERDDTYATIDAAGRDQILIGRVQADPRIENAFWIWAVADNLRRGAALNAVMLAETMLDRFGEKAN